VLLSTLSLSGQTNTDSALSTTNREQILQFRRAFGHGGLIIVLGFGDSVSASFQSAQKYVFGRLQADFGSAGSAFENGANRSLWQYGEGAARTGPTTNWWMSHGLLPPGGFIFWTNLASSIGSVACDQMGLCWVAYLGGGPFTACVSTNGGIGADRWPFSMATVLRPSEEQLGLTSERAFTGCGSTARPEPT